MAVGRIGEGNLTLVGVREVGGGNRVGSEEGAGLRNEVRKDGMNVGKNKGGEGELNTRFGKTGFGRRGHSEDWRRKGCGWGIQWE